jgi:hypothetical protein
LQPKFSRRSFNGTTPWLAATARLAGSFIDFNFDFILGRN